MISELESMGFAWLGKRAEVQTDDEQLSPEWHLVSSTGDVIVLVSQPAGASFQPSLVLGTLYPDEGLLETRYSGGFTVKRQDYRAYAQTESIQRAYRLHQERMTQFEAEHGAPLQFSDMKQYCEVGAPIYRRHAPHFIRASMWQASGIVILPMVGSLIFLGIGVLTLNAGLSETLFVLSMFSNVVIAIFALWLIRLYAKALKESS